MDRTFSIIVRDKEVVRTVSDLILITSDTSGEDIANTLERIDETQVLHVLDMTNLSIYTMVYDQKYGWVNKDILIKSIDLDKELDWQDAIDKIEKTADMFDKLHIDASFIFNSVIKLP